MIYIQDKTLCCGCSACVECCPRHCISMQEDNEGFLYPTVDAEKCIGCNLCEKVCPGIDPNEHRRPLDTYAAKNPDDKVRLLSSSGGIFSMLAERTIRRGGVVFGARFDENWEVVHDYAETIEGMELFRGSKYVQSRMDCSYRKAEVFLRTGRDVLFSGTPCQIVGLKRFLRKDYDNLLTVDVICHGVPSPGVWRQYLKEIMLRPKGVAAGKNTVLSSLNEMPVVTGISFRDKRLGWKKFGFEIRMSALKADKNSVLKSGKYPKEFFLFERQRENIFLRGFFANIYLRRSCYACPAKAGCSHSDITLGDYWGIDSLMPQLDDDRGVSAVLVNSEYGARALSETGAELHAVPYKDVERKNPALVRSVIQPANRSAFYRDTSDLLLPKIAYYSQPSVKNRIRCFVRSVVTRYGLLSLFPKNKRSQ